MVCVNFFHAIIILMFLVRKLGGKKPFEKLKGRRENNIKIENKLIRCDGVDWIHVVGPTVGLS
jgi:hypothetical protein